MSYYIYNNETSTGIVLDGDFMCIFSGGVANSTTLNSGGCFVFQ